MKRLVIALILLQLATFVYFSYQIDTIKEVVTNNAKIANDRAKATVEAEKNFQYQINAIKDLITAMATHWNDKK